MYQLYDTQRKLCRMRHATQHSFPQSVLHNFHSLCPFFSAFLHFSSLFLLLLHSLLLLPPLFPQPLLVPFHAGAHDLSVADLGGVRVDDGRHRRQGGKANGHGRAALGEP